MSQNKEAQDETTQVALEEEAKELLQSLPKVASFGGQMPLVNYEGFWYYDDPLIFKDNLDFQRNFRARDTDIILASHPKTGTTWLKSILFLLVNRKTPRKNDVALSSLLSARHPHELVPRLETEVFSPNPPIDGPVDDLPSPRLFSTHFPYTSLPGSIKSSGCRVLYVTRNPLDTCVSQWHFYGRVKKQFVGEEFEYPSVEAYFEDFLRGDVIHGPFLDHTLGYWAQSRERPEKVMFLRYEDLKEESAAQLRRLAGFLGLPFSPEEEREGVADEIVRACSIGSLKGMEANKEGGRINGIVDKSFYFRKGEVGGWAQHLTPSMKERMSKLMDEKLRGTGLSFNLGP